MLANLTLNDYLRAILTTRVYEAAHETELSKAKQLSAQFGQNIYLKREDQQPIFSFKLRGAYHKVASLSEEKRTKGVICASAGNHAQGVALAASRLHCRAVIVMPRTTPPIKVQAVKQWGAEVVLHGDAFDEAAAHAMQLCTEQQLTYIPPYDDPEVIAGQGTIGIELLRQCPDVQAVFIPVGGGGLLAGIAAYLKAVKPEIKIIAVESEESPCFQAAFAAKQRVTLEQQVGLFADGIAVKQLGAEPFRVVFELSETPLVDECLTVSVDEICAAMRDTFYETRSLPEPAGAVALAGVKKWLNKNSENIDKNQNFIVINSGANVSFDRLRHVAERAEQEEVLLAIEIPEVQGSFKQFCAELGDSNITEFNYRLQNTECAMIFVGIKTNLTHKKNIIHKLQEKYPKIRDLTHNEMAKIHIRYMVGGRKIRDHKERLLRFEFPERPGALLKFLDTLGSAWNISLFHYRNHGSAYGRVLVGLEVPDTQWEVCRNILHKLNYNLQDESENTAYHLFL